MDPWFTTPTDFSSDFNHFFQTFPGTHLPPSFEIPAPHERPLDGQFVADQSHSHAPPNPFSDFFIQELHNASSSDNMNGLGAAAAQITPTPTAGLPRKSRKKKAPTLRDEDFEPFKDRILELYETQKLPLEKVKSMIEEEFGFNAQPRQYQTRITKWGKDKNIKKAEMTAIARKHQQREILQTDKRKLRFTVRGREVDAGKIDRWMDRNNVPRNDLYAPSPAASTPSAVDCRTISERGSLAHSPALSEMSLTFSTGGITPVAQSPMASSPALSVRGIIQGRGSTFIGQSPAPIYRALPAQLPTSYSSSINPVHPHSSSTLAQQYRYRQDDEDRLRSEISVAETLFGFEHVETLHILVMLADILLQQGRWKSAEEMTRRAIAGYQKTVGGDDIRTLDALERLGQVLGHQGLYRRASKLLEELLETKKVTLGDEHRSTLTCMTSLSNIYLNQGQWDKVALLSEQALEISKRIRGSADDGTQRIMADLGFAYLCLGRLEESKQLIGQAVKLSKNHFGDEHPGTLNIMSCLQAFYSRQSDWGQAEVIAIQVVNACMKVFGEEHPRTLWAKRNLATAYRSLGQLEKAKDTEEQAFEGLKRILGENYPDKLDVAGDLIYVYEK